MKGLERDEAEAVPVLAAPSAPVDMLLDTESSYLSYGAGLSVGSVG